MTVTLTEPTVQTADTYRDNIVAVEPGGNEYIAEADRHGKPSQLFWTWTSPNLEFATIFVGVLTVAVFGMNFWQAVIGIVIGTAWVRSRTTSCPRAAHCMVCRRWCWADLRSGSREMRYRPC